MRDGPKPHFDAEFPGDIVCRSYSTIAWAGRSGACAIAPSGSRGAATCRYRPRASTFAPRALRDTPAIAAAFEDGRLSYSKVRALTRVVECRDEDTLLAYALEVSAEQLEERCREIRNASPEQSVGGAWRAWEHRSLIVSRDPARAMLKITVELPIEDGEVVIPKAGYRLYDMLDDDVRTGDAPTPAQPSAEGYRLPSHDPRQASAEVRENAPVYLVRREATAPSRAHWWSRHFASIDSQFTSTVRSPCTANDGATIRRSPFGSTSML